jgi:hypothetical protein
MRAHDAAVEWQFSSSAPSAAEAADVRSEIAL